MTGEAVVITDVGPRDGLQNQLKLLSIDERVQLIKAVAAAGVAQVEVGSFVSPKAVPAMAATDQVFAELQGQADYSAPVHRTDPKYERVRTRQGGWCQDCHDGALRQRWHGAKKRIDEHG